MNTKLYAALALTGTLCFTAGIAGAQTTTPATPAAGAHDHHSHSTKTWDLGTTTIGSLKIEAVTQEGPVVPGQEAAFDVVIGEGATPPKALRAWIGVESAQGSAKGKAEKEPNRHYHNHVRVPDPLPAGSKFWLEVEPETGKSARAGFKFFTE